MKEIKICEKAIAKQIKKQNECTTQEEYFETKKMIRSYKRTMLDQANRLAAQLQKLLDSDKDYYMKYATSPHEKMMQEYLTENPTL